ncbi:MULTISPECIES: MDR family oxidoreductase [unclassified Oceanobacter]|jgi:acrylyl-CoA reductase (NADPH)|uniref:acrylyl-CoA reductase (NADPH) n=2 Tax=Gammaproteobacteria TaxID=1236 RepID=UPI00273524D6|nr:MULTISPECIES: MDR family oxidoreductase [unclassified Oceanobacter]MDP2506553.1 MDR family oxidoreductase [Oceanobacter sp. 3_MG-2023]MDP2549369.1 MDR family oxidoreductase [Oceanobacter sp. 4_MG-2023]MDP2609432.1 MDR family oxidoreductase [Oceanobacter sp. 1_MG-2023]MDP2612868.1 MDR family oxidoreductase [Oceanobacter sp. 2_MG-2023]
MFKAIQINKDDQGYRAELTQLDDSALPEGDVTVKVHYSTLNYKDGLALTGKAPVVRRFPLTPGIDLVGTVESCSSEAFAVGDTVLLNGFGVGEVHSGGLAQRARLNSDWLIPLPEGLSGQQAMSIGTAGYTAMLCVQALQRNGVTPDQGDILVTGANGGVGSFAIGLLSRLGYRVIASTGRPEEADYLKQLGAADIIERQLLSEPGKPLQKEQWAGAVDSVGSHTLANVLAGTRYGGTVAACGLAQGADLPATVMPFILRGITLAGVDSVMRPKADRLAAWKQLAELVDAEMLAGITREIGLEQVIETASDLLAGKVRGRIVVALD